MRFLTLGSKVFLLLNALLLCDARLQSVEWVPHRHQMAVVHTVSTVEQQPQPQVTLSRVLSALDRLLQFLLDNASELNFDAVLGTRIAEGQLTVLLDSLVSSPSSFNVSSADAIEVYRLVNLARVVCEKADTTLKYRTLSTQLQELVESNFWNFAYTARVTDSNLVFPVVSADERLNENISDDCISEMLRKGIDGDFLCNPSDLCWKTMTMLYTSRYSLTHEIIYLMVGERVGCENEMNELSIKRKGLDYHEILDVFCSNCLQEMKEASAKGFLGRDRDLFLEQTAVCGMLGYKDVFRHSWLKEILSWQRVPGCYGYSFGSQEYLRFNRSMSSHRRSRREEKHLKEDCFAHKSAVAVAALSVYAKTLAKDPFLSVPV